MLAFILTCHCPTMAIISSFSDDTFADFFKNNLKLDKDQTKYLVQQCWRNEKILCLKVSPQDEDVDMEHLMIKMLQTEDINKKKIEYSENLENVFTVQDDNKDIYLGFAKKGILCPYKNNLENLRTILKSLAEFQVNSLDRRKNVSVKTIEYSVQNICDDVVYLDIFKDLNEIDINGLILTLQHSVDELFKDGLVVKSVGSIFANNVFITPSNKCVFLDLGYEVFRSPVFDALIFVFALSDEKFRQHNLKMLLKFYYESFIEAVKNIDQKIFKSFDFNEFERHIKIMLPIVKFETAAYLIQKEKTVQENKNLEELLNNIFYSLKYRHLSYEDVLDAVSNKLGSTYFELVNYQLIALDQKNGSLGQYFNLKSAAIFRDKIEELDMFVKVLATDNLHLNAVVQSGVSRKEQIFFRTLIPLFREYGLESLVDFVPNCYFDRLNDVIIQDNVVKLGYRPFTTDSKVGYDVLKSAFSQAAKLHACTLILEDRMSKRNNTIVRLGDLYNEYLEDWIFLEREGLPNSPVCAIDSKPGLDELIDYFEDIPKEISKEEFHKRVDAIFETFLEKVTSPAKQFRNVVCHGDFYASNFLTKYDEANVAQNCLLVDFQGLRYAPITEDILMLAYYSTHKDVRDKYLDKLLEEYYQELKKNMTQFGLDINTFYTPKEFTDCVKYMKPVIIIAGIFYGQFVALTPEKRKVILSDDNIFNYYFHENRKEHIKFLVSVPDECTVFLKGLIEDLYQVCVNNDFL